MEIIELGFARRARVGHVRASGASRRAWRQARAYRPLPNEADSPRRWYSAAISSVELSRRGGT